MQTFHIEHFGNPGSRATLIQVASIQTDTIHGECKAHSVMTAQSEFPTAH